jgi:hypothetical protein
MRNRHTSDPDLSPLFRRSLGIQSEGIPLVLLCAVARRDQGQLFFAAPASTPATRLRHACGYFPNPNVIGARLWLICAPSDAWAASAITAARSNLALVIPPLSLQSLHALLLKPL